MNNTLVSKKRKGLSPLLATVILIGVTVAGGGAVYSLYTGSSATAGASNAIQIEAVNAVKGSNHADFTATVKNAGTSAWKSLEVWVGKEAGSRPVLYEELHEAAAGTGGEIENPLRTEAIAVLSDGTPAALGRKFVLATEGLPKQREVTAYPSAQNANLKNLDGKWSGSTVNCASDTNTGLNGTQCTVYTGKRLSGPIEPGQTIRVYADMLLPGQIKSTDIPASPGNNPMLNPIVDLRLGDELTVNVKAVTVDGQEVQAQTVVRLIGA